MTCAQIDWRRFGGTLTFVDFFFNYSGSRGGAVANANKKCNQFNYRLHERVSHPELNNIHPWMDTWSLALDSEVGRLGLVGWWTLPSNSIFHLTKLKASNMSNSKSKFFHILSFMIQISGFSKSKKKESSLGLFNQIIPVQVTQGQDK